MISQETTYPSQIVFSQDSYGKESSKRKSNGWKNVWFLKEIYKSKMLLNLKGKNLEWCTLLSSLTRPTPEATKGHMLKRS